MSRRAPQITGERVFLSVPLSYKKDSIVYPRALCPELRIMDPRHVHPVPDYSGATKEERVQRIQQMIGDAPDLSPQLIYWACKKRDGIPGDTGTRPDIAMQVRIERVFAEIRSTPRPRPGPARDELIAVMREAIQA